MSRVFIFFIILLIMIIGIVALQIFLSKKQGKWFGFILPSITFLFSVIAVMGIVAISTLTSSEQSVSESGEVVNHVVNSVTTHRNISSTIFTSIYIFILYNIPTVILVTIYFACREKLKKNKEIEKMNIQDLE